VLLLTDLVMPGISGLDLAERVREICPEVAVLFMSGYSQDMLGPKRILDEGVALIQKPFTEQALLGKVGAIVAARNRTADPAP
jgi:FixJ family two-component response regulator